MASVLSRLRVLSLLAASATAIATEAPVPVIPGAGGQLQYLPTAGEDRVLDFSFAGYHGGGVALPNVPTVVTVSPTGKGDAEAIQAAIDSVAAMPLRGGHRGAVQLAPGTFSCDDVIRIEASGIVVRGAGSGPGGTRLSLTGHPHPAFSLGSSDRDESPGLGEPVVDEVIPSGSSRVTVAHPSGFHAGDTVAVVRPVTKAWVHFMGMDGLVRNGKPEVWVKGDIRTLRTIVAVEGSVLQLDVPLPDRFEKATMGALYVTAVKPPAHPGEVGVEALSIACEAQHVKLGEPAFSGIRVRGLDDSWLRDLVLANTQDTVSFASNSRRITAQGLVTTHAAAIIGAAKPADFSIDGTQILVDRCRNQGDEVFYVATGAEVTGPNVVLHCTFTGGGWVQPHQRWATGLLVDSCSVPGGGIDFMNRGQMGSGHGWTIGWSVAWNCSAKSFIVQNPPGSLNWAVGCTGAIEEAAQPFDKGPMIPTGMIASMNRPVSPDSLYLEQLRERLGPAAVKAIGY